MAGSTYNMYVLYHKFSAWIWDGKSRTIYVVHYTEEDQERFWVSTNFWDKY